MVDLCISCQKTVTTRQEALLCDGCQHWQHRICNTGITREQYRNAIRSEAEIAWRCQHCTFDLPIAESTREDEDPQPESELGTVQEVTKYSNGSDTTEIPPQLDELSNAATPADSSDTAELSYEIPPQLDELSNAATPADSSDTAELSYEIPPQLDESSIAETPIEVDPVIDEEPPPITFEIVEGCSKRGQKKLFDNRGYSYCVKQRKNTVTYWHCSVRGKHQHCPASVIQRHDGFYPSVEHNHPGETGLPAVAKVTTAIKRKAADDLFRPAFAIVDEVLLDVMDEQPCATLPRPEHLARAANRLRQSQRPPEPTDLDFLISNDNVPENFLQADVKIRGRRHLMFATAEQLQLLSSAKTWYVDGTFKLCRAPFTQLFSINVFVRQGDHAKQVPALFVLMSGRKKSDYKKILKNLLEILPTAPRVHQVTMDFERAVWRAFQHVFPDVHLMGCLFHWNQALWRKVQELGLQSAYSTCRAINRPVIR